MLGRHCQMGTRDDSLPRAVRCWSSPDPFKATDLSLIARPFQLASTAMMGVAFRSGGCWASQHKCPHRCSGAASRPSAFVKSFRASAGIRKAPRKGPAGHGGKYGGFRLTAGGGDGATAALYHARGRVHFRCAYGGREGLKSIRECTFRYEPDLLTLMITRGRRCEIVDLKRRCAARYAALFAPPSAPRCRASSIRRPYRYH